MTVSNIDKSDALLISTRDGTYPHSEDVLKATLDDTALESSLQRVNEAKKQIEVGILSMLAMDTFLTDALIDGHSRPQPERLLRR